MSVMAEIHLTVVFRDRRASYDQKYIADLQRALGQRLFHDGEAHPIVENITYGHYLILTPFKGG